MPMSRSLGCFALAVAAALVGHANGFASTGLSIRSRCTFAVHRSPLASLLRDGAQQPMYAFTQGARLPSWKKRMSASMMATVVKETPLRSFVKAAGWRFTAGIVTAVSSFIFTGSLATAASIVGWDLFSKSGTMFIGERLWNNVKWGKSKTGDSSKRSLAKALAWRLFAAINTLFAATILTKGKTGVASKIAGSDSVVKTILFFFYERAWALVPWGKLFSEEDYPVEEAIEESPSVDSA